MGDDYRDLEKRERLGDPPPPVSRCSACRGTTRVRGERCPECDGGGTLEAQKAYMSKLVACAAAERVPRFERIVAIAKGAAIVDLGAPLLELCRGRLGPGDVLVWHAPADLPNDQARAFCRRFREYLSPEHRPAAIIVLRDGDHLDAFHVGADVSPEGIRLGLQEHADKLQELVPGPPLGTQTLRELARLNKARKTAWKDELERRFKDRGLKPVVEEICKWLSSYGYDVTPKKTFAEIMAERSRDWMGPPRDTPEERLRFAEALEAECLKVIECDSQGLMSELHNALEAVTEAVPLHGRFLMIVLSNGARSKLGNPTSIHGIMVSSTMHDLTPDDRIVVVAVREGELWEPSHTVVVRWTDTGDPLEGIKLYDTEPPAEEPTEFHGSSFKCTCGEVSSDIGETIYTVACPGSGCGRWWRRELDPLTPWEVVSEEEFVHCRCGQLALVAKNVAMVTCEGCGTSWIRPKEGSLWIEDGTPDIEVDVLPPEVAKKALEEYVEKREEWLETIFAKRGSEDSWSLERDNLECVCGVAWVMRRPGVGISEDRAKDCVCGRTLQKISTSPDGSRWEVSEEPKQEEHLSCTCGWLHKDVQADVFRCAECSRDWWRLDGVWQEKSVPAEKTHSDPRFDRIECACGAWHERRMEAALKHQLERTFGCACGRTFRFHKLTETGSRWEVEGP